MARAFASFIFVVGVAGGSFAEDPPRPRPMNRSVVADGSFAEDRHPSVGDIVVITMKGDVAMEYIRLRGEGETMGIDRAAPNSKFSVEIPGTISQEIGGGYFLIDHFTEISTADEPLRLVSFSTIFKASQLKTQPAPKNADRKATNDSASNVPYLKTERIPKNTVINSPGDTVPVIATQQEVKRWKLLLSELKAVKFQTWELDGEIAN